MDAALSLALTLLRKYLPYVIGAVALIGLGIWIDHRGYQRGFHHRDAEVAALNVTIANMKTASAQAAAANLAHVRDVETKQAQITKEQTDALSQQLADARAAASAYVVRHPAQAAPGHAGASGLPQAAGTAGTTDAAPQSAVVAVSDIDACTDAYVIARGWQDWWSAISASPPNPPPPMAR